MPSYDFRCENCGADLTLFYKSFRAYDEATPVCSQCGSTQLKRTITSVNIGKGSSARNYADMSANEMLSVFESGDSRAVGEMMKQVGAGTPDAALGENYHNAAEQLSKGASKDTVERDLRHNALGTASDEPLPKAKPNPKS